MLVAVALALLVLAPVFARAQASDSLTLHWTAPADPGPGAVARYDVRMSTSPITTANFATAQAVGSGTPGAPGAVETLVVRGVDRRNSYWFAIRSLSTVGHWSPLSNVVRWVGQGDTAPPAAPAGIAELGPARGAVTLLWRANTEPDLAGYAIYRASAASGPWTRLNTVLVTDTSYVDGSLPLGASQLWYAVTAADRYGNESGRSATLAVTLPSASVSSPIAWRLAAPYPNPAHVSDAIHLPVEAPPGAGVAHIEIFDAAGRRIAWLGVVPPSGGRVTVDWDGSTIAGLRAAPGVYRALLYAGEARQAVRVVRLP